MPMISPEVNDKLNDLVAYQFYLNRVWDAGLSKLNVDFVMVKFEAAFHAGLAHKFPIIADKISEIQTNFNNVTTYKPTPQGKNDYATPLDFFEFALAEMVKGQKMIAETMMWLDEQPDDMGVNASICAALLRLQRFFAAYVGQAILLRDKSKAYGQKPLNIQLFDAEASNWLTVPGDIPSLLD